MRPMKIGYTAHVADSFTTERTRVNLADTDFTDIAAAVLSDKDIDIFEKIDATRFGVPVFLFTEDPDNFEHESSARIFRIVPEYSFSVKRLTTEIEAAAKQYEERMLPPFFEKLSDYMDLENLQFDCPGHQSGAYFKKHPAGRYLFDFYGEMIFQSDICNADVAMGDLLIHEGPPNDARKNASKVFNSDETYFVLNGSSTSNNVAIGATVSPDDLVLFDRNNHKSVYDAALIQCAGIPLYLQTVRNHYGFIGGIDDSCFEEASIRAEIAKVAPGRENLPRPIRLAVIQLGTYDGTIYNARQVLDRIGHLCEYILFDSAWVGYEQFIPMMRDCSPLLLELGPDDPGILVVQSVHKQQAGFSQTSYIHKKDHHLEGQKRFVNQERFNNSYRLHASTSPFYPLFASLDVNARMQDRGSGRKLWDDCVKIGIETRKKIMKHCKLLRPFVPETVDGSEWASYQTDRIASDISFFRFEPGEIWHGYEGYGKDQYFVDPNKLMLTTPGIDMVTGEYADFGVPATILASYLRDNRIIPEKNDFNSILFLMTPAEDMIKMDSLVSQLIRFEKLLEEDVSMSEALPFLYTEHIERYRGYTIRELCQEMHDFYKSKDAKTLQKRLFRKEYFPEQAMSPSSANIHLVRNNARLVKVSEIEGEIALEGALPYPPGIFCVVPGERWSKTVVDYFLILEEGINRFPGFSPEIHGVYLKEKEGITTAWGYVYDENV